MTWSFLRTPVGCLLAGSLSCTHASLDGDLENLEAQEAQRRRRLDELDRRIGDAEARSAAARAEAEYHQCRAVAAHLDAEAKILVSSCTAQIAERAKCVAETESRRAKSAGLGCALGWGAAILSGGAAAPAVIAGCVGGAALSEATKKKCGDPPECASRSPEEIEAGVLRAAGLSGPLACEPPANASPERMVEASSSPNTSSRRRASKSCSPSGVAKVHLEIPAKHSDGSPWDPNRSAPDLIYELRVNGIRQYESEVYETNEWVHTPTTQVRVGPGQRLEILVFDKDPTRRERVAIGKVEVPQVTDGEPIKMKSGRSLVAVEFSCADQ